MSTPTPTIRKTTSTVETIEYSLTAEDILNALHKAGVIKPIGAYDPTEKAEVFICVPGGGDYSNCRLDIGDKRVPLQVVITRANQTTT